MINLDHWNTNELINEFHKQRTLLDTTLDVQSDEFCAECCFDAVIRSTHNMMRIIKEELIKRKKDIPNIIDYDFDQ